MSITSLLTRRYLRRGLARPNLTYYFWRFVANGRRTRRLKATPPAFGDAPAVADTLRREGIIVGDAGQFLSEPGRQALRDATARVLRASESDAVNQLTRGEAVDTSRQKDFMIHLMTYPDGVPVDDPLLAVALDQRLLEIVGSYLGLWPSLYSVSAWLHYPTDAPAQQSQLWHRDPEDLKLVKVFIYLNEVNEECGPFTYIPGTQPFGPRTAAAGVLEGKKRVTDDAMGEVYPRESWKVCTGAANTMILADTVGYHRGGKPSAGRRVLIAFTYTSGAPIKKPAVRVQTTPAWASTGIQRAAISQILR